MMGNDISLVSKNNETKMSDNEAFMAYMSKAEMGDEDDEWIQILSINLFSFHSQLLK